MDVAGHGERSGIFICRPKVARCQPPEDKYCRLPSDGTADLSNLVVVQNVWVHNQRKNNFHLSFM